MGFEKMAEDIIDQQNKLFPHLEDLRHHEEMPESLKRAMDAVRAWSDKVEAHDEAAINNSQPAEEFAIELEKHRGMIGKHWEPEIDKYRDLVNNYAETDVLATDYE